MLLDLSAVPGPHEPVDARPVVSPLPADPREAEVGPVALYHVRQLRHDPGLPPGEGPGAPAAARGLAKESEEGRVLRDPGEPLALRPDQEHRGRLPEERGVVAPSENLSGRDTDPRHVGGERPAPGDVAPPGEVADREASAVLPGKVRVVPKEEVHQPREAVQQARRPRSVGERNVDELLDGRLVDDRPVVPASRADRVVVARPPRPIAVVVPRDRPERWMDAAAERCIAELGESGPRLRLERAKLLGEAPEGDGGGSRDFEKGSRVGRHHLLRGDAWTCHGVLAHDTELLRLPAGLGEDLPETQEDVRGRRPAIGERDDGHLQLGADERRQSAADFRGKPPAAFHARGARSAWLLTARRVCGRGAQPDLFRRPVPGRSCRSTAGGSARSSSRQGPGSGALEALRRCFGTGPRRP